MKEILICFMLLISFSVSANEEFQLICRNVEGVKVIDFNVEVPADLFMHIQRSKTSSKIFKYPRGYNGVGKKGYTLDEVKALETKIVVTDNLNQGYEKVFSTTFSVNDRVMPYQGNNKDLFLHIIRKSHKNTRKVDYILALEKFLVNGEVHSGYKNDRYSGLFDIVVDRTNNAVADTMNTMMGTIENFFPRGKPNQDVICKMVSLLF